MSTRRFAQVDVFATGPFTGNPVAVVLDGAELSQERMRALARWTNLSETTFVLPPTAPGADYLVRILTPAVELPFAGHPTLGTAHAWLAAGGVPANPAVIVQECGVGLVRVRRDGPALAFAAPPRIRTGPVDEPTLAVVAAGLGLAREEIRSHQWVANGPGWLAVELADDERVRQARPTAAGFGGLEVGVFGMAAEGAPFRYEIRGFVPAPAPPEDPVTGSLNASVAQWLREEGRVPSRYAVRQGSALGRAGELQITDDGTDIWVGGRVQARVSGVIDLD